MALDLQLIMDISQANSIARLATKLAPYKIIQGVLMVFVFVVMFVGNGSV